MSRTRAAAPWLLIGAAVVLVGLNLRGPVIAVAPVLGQIGADLGLDPAGLGLLTTLPVLCFALATPLASYLIATGGVNLAITVTLAGVVLGTIIRSADGVAGAIAGTIVLGVFITIGNVAVPVVIQAEVPRAHVGAVTGVYTASLNVGAMLTSLATAPLAEWTGWRLALVAWGVLAVGGVVLWRTAVGPSAFRWGATAPSIATGPVGVNRSGGAGRKAQLVLTVLLTICFTGQAFGYYGMTAWLPTILADEQGFTASEAGASSSLFQVAAVAGALGAPLLVRLIGRVATFALTAALWITIPVGLITASQLWLLWSITGGIAQGAGITLVFMLIVVVARNRTQSRRLSAVVQGVGYAGASLAPTALGAVHQATDAWTVPLLIVLGALTAFSLFGIVVSALTSLRERTT